MPLGEHSTIQGELIIAINAVVKPQNLQGHRCISWTFQWRPGGNPDFELSIASITAERSRSEQVGVDASSDEAPTKKIWLTK